MTGYLNFKDGVWDWHCMVGGTALSQILNTTLFVFFSIYVVCRNF